MKYLLYSLLLLLTLSSCKSYELNYSNIKRIETISLPFGANFPIELGESLSEFPGNIHVIEDKDKIDEIEALLWELEESNEENLVKRNVYLRSKIIFSDNKDTLFLITNRHRILINGKLFKYSDSLIYELRP